MGVWQHPVLDLFKLAAIESFPHGDFHIEGSAAYNTVMNTVALVPFVQRDMCLH